MKVHPLIASALISAIIALQGTTTFNTSGTNVTVSTITANSLNAGSVNAGTLSGVLADTNIVPSVAVLTAANWSGLAPGGHLAASPAIFLVINGYPFTDLYLPRIRSRKMAITVRLVAAPGGLKIHADSADAITPSGFDSTGLPMNSTFNFITDGSTNWWTF